VDDGGFIAGGCRDGGGSSRDCLILRHNFHKPDTARWLLCPVPLPVAAVRDGGTMWVARASSRVANKYELSDDM